MAFSFAGWWVRETQPYTWWSASTQTAGAAAPGDENGGRPRTPIANEVSDDCATRPLREPGPALVHMHRHVRQQHVRRRERRRHLRRSAAEDAQELDRLRRGRAALARVAGGDSDRAGR